MIGGRGGNSVGGDDGSASYAEEQAVSWLASAWFRRTHTEKGNGGEIMLKIADHARSHITPEQWNEIGNV